MFDDGFPLFLVVKYGVLRVSLNRREEGPGTGHTELEVDHGIVSRETRGIECEGIVPSNASATKFLSRIFAIIPLELTTCDTECRGYGRESTIIAATQAGR